MNHANTKHLNGKHLNGTGVSSLSCPACGSKISPEQFTQILKIDEAREKHLNDELKALEAESEALDRDREQIKKAAATAERAKWEADKTRIAREIERLQNQTKMEQERVARAHEKEIVAVQRRSETHEKKLAQQLVAMKAKGASEAVVREREAKRAAEAEQRDLVDDLKSQLKTAEQRRRRDEENFKKVVAELRRKTEARDREHLGIEGEEDLVTALRAEFPSDRIEHHGKGGDVLHYVMDGGREAGVIVNEVKNRTTWSADYVSQTQRAMETHGTKFGVLVSRVLPSRKVGMCVMRGVLVVAPFIAAQVIRVVRDGIVAIHRLNLSEDDKASKMGALFTYLRGEEFETAMNRIVTKITELRDSLSRERSSHDGWWRAREQQYAAILREATGIDSRVRDLLSGPTSDVRVKALTPATATVK